VNLSEQVEERAVSFAGKLQVLRGVPHASSVELLKELLSVPL
jgi:hypothetical protein